MRFSLIFWINSFNHTDGKRIWDFHSMFCLNNKLIQSKVGKRIWYFHSICLNNQLIQLHKDVRGFDVFNWYLFDQLTHSIKQFVRGFKILVDICLTINSFNQTDSKRIWDFNWYLFWAINQIESKRIWDFHLIIIR